MPEVARRRRRREVAFHGASIPRRAMTEEEAASLQSGVDRGSNAEFGLVKLSHLQLNAAIVHQPPPPSPPSARPPEVQQQQQPRQQQQQQQQQQQSSSTSTPPERQPPPPSNAASAPGAPRPWPGGSITLLAYAAWRGKDAIAGALLRAGADASARHDSHQHPEAARAASEAAHASLSAVQRMHAVWIVKQVVAMRAAAAEAAAAAGMAQPGETAAGAEAAAVGREATARATAGVAQGEADGEAQGQAEREAGAAELLDQPRDGEGLIAVRSGDAGVAGSGVLQPALQQPQGSEQHAKVQAGPVTPTTTGQRQLEPGVHSSMQTRCAAPAAAPEGTSLPSASQQQPSCCRLCSGPLHLPLAFPACGHVCCEPCLWLKLEGVVSGEGPDLEGEGVGNRSGEGALVCPCMEAEIVERRRMQGEAAQPNEEARRRKRESKERWDQLPDMPPSSRELRSTALAKPKFEARTATEVARLFMGATRAQRQGNLWKAASEGITERIRALVEAGVAVDGQNEYGQTALYLAAAHGHEAAVRLLCGWAAADPKVCAAGGSLPVTVAAAAGHAGVVRALGHAGADLGAADGEGRQAWRHAWAGRHGAVVDVLCQFGAAGGAAVGPGSMDEDYAADQRMCASSACRGCLRCEGCPGCTGGLGVGGPGARQADADGAPPPRPCSCLCNAQVLCLVPEDAQHPGAGSYALDGCLTKGELRRLKALWERMPPPLDGSGLSGGNRFRRGKAVRRAQVGGAAEVGEAQEAGEPGQGAPEGPDVWAQGEAQEGAEAGGGGAGEGEGGKTARQSVYGGVQRSHFFDADGWVRRTLRRAVRRAAGVGMVSPLAGEALPGMRFLRYAHAGAAMAPHVDLSKSILLNAGGGTCVPKGRGSTPAEAEQQQQQQQQRRSSSHTFVLYLESCGEGGETLLLEREGPSIETSGRVLAAVQPKAGRLLLFPHKCPHAGAPVVTDQLPKLLLRGEMY